MKKNSKNKIYSTYAQSLYQAAVDSKKLDKICEDVELLKGLISDDSQIVSCLNNQIWPVSSKIEAIADISKKLKLNKETVSFLNIIITNRRVSDLAGILDEFGHIYFRKHGIEEVEVVTAKSLSSAQDSKLKNMLEKKLAKKVLIKYTINPDLLGGLIVKYDSLMIDDSLKGKLTRLEIMMKGGQ